MVKESKLYDLLGVSPSAGEAELKKGYKKSALKYHPDKPTGDTEKFKEISEAFDILSDPEKRKIYDAYGLEAARRGGVMPEPSENGGGGYPGGAGGFPGFGGATNGGAGGPFMFSSGTPGGAQSFSFSTGGPGGGYAPFSSTDAFNIFQNFSESGGFDGEDDIFNILGGRTRGRASGHPFGSGGGGGMPRSAHSNAADIKHDPLTIDLPVSLEDLAKGVTKKMKVKRRNKGKLEENILTVNIKPGWKAGTKLTYPNSGEIFSDGSSQDVVFVIQEKPNSSFKRIDNDLETTLDLSLKDSLCGFSKIIETIDGKRIKVENRRPISPGHVIKYPGRGMPLSKSPGNHGDLLIKINVKYPDELTPAQREAIESNF